ncbi:MAG TPA: hypothetical protein VF013_05005 [Candidatus Limnocylindria bacterium]
MQRTAQRVVIALLLVNAIVRVWLIATDWNFQDVDAYWDAAMRLRHGEALYPIGLDPDNYRVFRYAPWFAWMWVPLTYLPRTIVDIAWAVVLAAASASILAGLARLRSTAGWALALLMTPWLLSLVQVGNIQPLVVASLAYGVSRRSGPVWIAINASLKAVPILWTLVCVARRQWGLVAITGVLTLVLSAPFLLYDLAGYMTDPGRSGASLYYYLGPQAWAVGALVTGAVAAWLAWRRSRWLWPAIALAVMAITPRSHITYATYLVIGVLQPLRDRLHEG